MTDAAAPRRVREPSLVDAILPLFILAVLIGGSLALFGLDALDGPIQVALVTLPHAGQPASRLAQHAVRRTLAQQRNSQRLAW